MPHEFVDRDRNAQHRGGFDLGRTPNMDGVHPTFLRFDAALVL